MTDRSPTITWVGHATVLVDTGAHRVVTDPTLTMRLAHLRRRVPRPALDRVDTVLVSHLHLDHLHLPSLRRLAPVPRVVVPHGGGPLVASVTTLVDEVEPGDRVVLGDDLAVQVVPAAHSSGRGPHSRASARPVGHIVEVAGDRPLRIYVAGDTDLFDGMADLGPVDVAFLPIWGWGPTIGEGHLDPERAAVATARIDPTVVVPMHWGTYSPVRAGRGAPDWLDRPFGAFRAALAERRLDDRLQHCPPGGTVRPG